MTRLQEDIAAIEKAWSATGHSGSATFLLIDDLMSIVQECKDVTKFTGNRL